MGFIADTFKRKTFYEEPKTKLGAVETGEQGKKKISSLIVTTEQNNLKNSKENVPDSTGTLIVTTEQNKQKNVKENAPDRTGKERLRTWRKNRTEREQLKPGFRQPYFSFLKGFTVIFIIGRPNRLIMALLLMSANAQDAPIPTIVTTPIVFGENVTFKCLYNDPTSSYLSTMWLKGKEKVAIAYGNISTDETKYSSSLKNEGSQLTYLLNVHSVSCTDLSTYRCEFNFVGANLTFNMNQRLSFIYLPDKKDMVFNITDTEPIQLKILIRNIYPQPKCTILFQEEDITDRIKDPVYLGMPLNSLEMEMKLNDCSGDLKISCLVGSRYFTQYEDIQQCNKGADCQTRTFFYYAAIVMISGVILAIIYTLFLVIYRLCIRSPGSDESVPMNEEPTSNYG